MHRLLAKQIKRATTADGTLDLARLLALVTAAYEEAERDHERSDRSINLMADELRAFNATLEAQVTARTREIEELRQRFEDAIEHIDQGILMIDAGNRVPVVNQRAIELLDIPEEILRSIPSFTALMEYQYARGEFALMDEDFHNAVLRQAHEHTPGLFVRQRPNGTFLEVRTRRLASGGSVRTYTDVTERERTNAALAAAAAEYRGLFDNAVVGVYRSSLDGRQLRANPTLVKLNGYDSEEEMLAAVRDISREWYVDPARRDEFRELMRRDGKVTDFVSEIYRHKTRERIWVSETAWIVRDAEGNPLFYEGTVVDATERIEQERRIVHMARHDALTDLPNRTFFLETLRKRLRRGRAAPPLAVLCIDLDRFKEVNDTLGHGAGDSLLRSAARRLLSLIGPQDIVARLGGDEFAVLLANAADQASVLDRADAMVETLSRPFSIGGQRAIIGASIGVAISGAHGDEPQELLKNADIALYKAKREGRQRTCFFETSMTVALHRRRMIELNLRSALAAGEFELHYQPIVDMLTGQPVSYEALLRWRHPQMGLISPGEFIPIAEDTGLMIPLGEWIIRRACQEAVRHFGGARVAVNLSPIQLRSPQIVGVIVNALASAGLPASQLELEITETVLLTDNKISYGALNELRDMGVRIALDDFGTGYSSLSYLQKFRFQKLKIDRSFVSSDGDGGINTAVIKAVIALANDIGMEVVAEGVEYEDQAQAMLRAGCHLIQGYLYGAPAPAAKHGAPLTEEPPPLTPDNVVSLLESAISAAAPTPGARKTA
jgi:diguanylate cyclase (GGDEF)-like protein/PAS domain S-box-containing protein